MDKLFLIVVTPLKIDYLYLEEAFKQYGKLYFYQDKGLWYMQISDGYISLNGEKVNISKLDKRYYEIFESDLFYHKKIYVYQDDADFKRYSLYFRHTLIVADNNQADIMMRDFPCKDAVLMLCNDHVQSNFLPLFLNGHPYQGEKLLNGDLLEWHGLKLFFHEQFLLINNLLGRVENGKENITFLSHFNDVPALKYNDMPKEEVLKRPIKPVEEKVHHKEFSPLIEQLGPGLTMTLAMVAVQGLNVYFNMLNGISIIQSLPYIILPLAMLGSTLFWPLAIRRYYRHKENKEAKIMHQAYERAMLKYLDDYTFYQEALFKIEQGHFFNFERFKEYALKGHLFFQYRKDEDFYRFTLGYSSKDQNPLFCSYKEHRLLYFYERKENNYYFIKRLLLELGAFKSFDDLLIVLYKAPLNIRYRFVPALFYRQKRYLIDDLSAIKELKDIQDREIIIMAFAPVSTFEIQENIHYFIYHNEEKGPFLNNGTYLKIGLGRGLFQNGENIQTFNFDIEKGDFNKAYQYLGAYLKLDEGMKDIIGLSDIFKMPLYDFDIAASHSQNKHGLIASFALFEKEFVFDMHEKGSGPHGLIGGTTGSGKSELLISLLLSMCLRYSPDYLKLVIIDYKGGGIVQSLSYNGRKLPHIYSDISNLDDDNLERLLKALNRECRSRQDAFKKRALALNKAVMNIDDYNENIDTSDRIARLLIVVDEFAELKKNHPESMRELISLSRIGRSLGLHLLLATQKPDTSIDDEIWSNSRFKIALKVQDKRASFELLHSDVAVNLKKPGQFYLRVDEDLYYAKASYPRLPLKGDKSLNLLKADFSLSFKYSIADDDSLSELTYAVKKINELYPEETYKQQKLFAPKPLSLTVDELLAKYHYKRVKGEIIIGELDDYQNLTQSLLTLKSDDGHILIMELQDHLHHLLGFGLKDSQKRIIYIGHKKPIHPQISDTISYWSDDVDYLFKSLIKSQKALDIIIIIEDLLVFLNYDDKYREAFYHLLNIADFLKLQIIAFLKSAANLPYRALAAFKNILLMGIKDRKELNALMLGNIPIKDAYYIKDRPIPLVPAKEMERQYSHTILAPFIPSLPDKISAFSDDVFFLLGYDLKDRKAVYARYDDKLTIVSRSRLLLKTYMTIYPRLASSSFYLYKDEQFPNIDGDILWLGHGLLSQRKIFHNLHKDLSDDEGLYIHDGLMLILRICHAEEDTTVS